MKNIKLNALPINSQTIREALGSVTCTFDRTWSTILVQGEEIETAGDNWVQAELSSEFTRGVSLQQVVVLAANDFVFTLSGNAYPGEEEYPKVSKIMSEISQLMLSDESRLAIFFTIFPSEDRRHYRCRDGVIESFDIIHSDEQSFKIQAYLPDAHNRLLLGTKQGLILEDATKNTLQPILRIPAVKWLTVDTRRHYYCGTEKNGVFKSEDGGVSWGRMTNLPVEEVFSLGIDPKNNAFYLNSASGVFVSINNGKSWRSMAEPFLSGDIREMVFEARHRILIVKTVDHCLFVREL